MWKKALWVYLWLYVLAVGGSYVYSIFQDGFEPASLVFLLLLFLPAVTAARALQGKKANIFLIIFSFLITAIPFVGVLNFNRGTYDLAVIGKNRDSLVF